MSINENRNCTCNMNVNNYSSNNMMSNNSNDNMILSSSSNNSVIYMNNSNDCSEPERTVDCDLRREMIENTRCLDFAINELALYLDTHPDDEKALCLHRKYCKEAKELKDKYQKVFGPITINFPCNKWRWIEEPWPWERGNF